MLLALAAGARLARTISMLRARNRIGCWRQGWPWTFSMLRARSSNATCIGCWSKVGQDILNAESQEQNQLLEGGAAMDLSDAKSQEWYWPLAELPIII